MVQSFAELVSWVPKSRHLGDSLAHAHDTARGQGHAEVGLDHLLLALLEDPDAYAVLQVCGIGTDAIQAELEARMAEHRPSQGEDPAVAEELSRIIEYAVAAARQSRRRDVNGAIVLAAIVGEGKSVAADVLRRNGLTFDEAIKALQSSAVKSRLQDPAQSGPPVTTEDILETARRRVKANASAASTAAGQAPVMATVTTAGAGLNGAHEEAARAQGQAVEVQVSAPATAAAAATTGTVPRPPPPPPGPPPVPLPPDAPAAVQAPVEVKPQRPRTMPPPLPPQAPPLANGRANPGHAAPQVVPGQAPATQSRAPGEAVWRPGEGRNGPAGGVGGRQGPGAAPGLAHGPGPNGIHTARADGVAIPIDPGKLADSIPRRMRAGLAESIEVRIARAQIAGMATATSGRAGAGQLASIVTRAVSVRLRAPDGGFVVETVAPETQWTDNLLGAYGSEFVSWRFIVTPDLAGARRLQLIISVRTVGVDGLTMETALPDQIVPVKVRANYAPALGRWAGLALAAIIGGVLARYGEGIWAIAAPVIRSFIGPG